jgi:hypothetical protein
VRLFAVLTERFAVVAGHDDQRVAGQATPFQRQDQAAQLRVGVGDLPVIAGASAVADEVSRRRVRGVRVVQVRPEKERPGAAVQPPDRGIDDLRRRPLGLEQFRSRRIPPDGVVVDVEAVRQTEAPIQHVGPDERASGITGVLQSPRQRRNLTVEDDAVLTNPMDGRNGPREQRCVGRQRERHRRADVLERYPSRSKPVDGWRQPASDPVGPQRVDGDEEDVQVSCRRDGRRLAQPDVQPGGRRGEDEKKGDEATLHRPIMSHGPGFYREVTLTLSKVAVASRVLS